MDNKIKTGIIGFGGFGKFIFKALSQSEQFLVTEIADAFTNSEDFSEEIQFHQDWHQLALSSEVEAVVIATPPSTHFEIALECIKEGKHVMIEKPLTTHFKKGITIKEAAKENECVVMVDFLQRFNPLLEHLHAMYKRNLLGKLERYYVENYAQDESLPKNHWFWDEEISGGILVEHAVHFIDLVHWFENAEIESMNGFAHSRNKLQKDRVSAQVLYKNGIMASQFHSFTRPNVFERTQMNFIFEKAQFRFDGWIPESGVFTLLGDEALKESLQVFPNLAITTFEPVECLPVRGKSFDYTHLIEGEFKARLPKQELYALAINNIFTDFYRKIQQPDYTTRLSLDDAIKAVYIAEHISNNASTPS